MHSSEMVGIKMRANRKVFALLLGLASLAHPALALLPHAPTEAELAKLPKGCQVKLGTGPQNAALWQSWSARVGNETWLHMHHYCGGLKFMNRARFTLDKAEKGFYLQSAIGEFNYVLKAWPANSPLMPEAQSQKTQAELMLKQL